MEIDDVLSSLPFLPVLKSAHLSHFLYSSDFKRDCPAKSTVFANAARVIRLGTKIENFLINMLFMEASRKNCRKFA